MTKDLHALTGAYVMDALDDDERAAFEAYMATSPATQAEVASPSRSAPCSVPRLPRPRPRGCVGP